MLIDRGSTTIRCDLCKSEQTSVGFNLGIAAFLGWVEVRHTDCLDPIVILRHYCPECWDRCWTVSAEELP